MALRNLGFIVDINGISPNMIADAGTQGEHNVTAVSFVLSNELRLEMDKLLVDGNIVMYRFDLYDGEGSIWQSDAKKWEGNTRLTLTLEERHTRFGGKITVYLVITTVSDDNETQVELYSFPAVLQLKSLPEGEHQEGENYESVTTLAEITKQKAMQASEAAAAAENSNKNLQAFAATIEEKLKNGEFDGVGVETAQIVNDELLITYTNDIVQNLGNIKGEKGDTPSLDNYYTKDEVNNLDAVKYVTQDDEMSVSLNSPNGNAYILLDDNDFVDILSEKGIYVNNKIITSVGNPEKDTDAATKGYVDKMFVDKVDKITLDKVVVVDDYELGIYGNLYNVGGADGTYYNGKPVLIKATKGSVVNTIPVRDANGSISVSIAIKDSEGNNYVGGAAPHTWVQANLNTLNERLYEFKNNATENLAQESSVRANADKNLQTQINELNLLKNVVEGKKITKYTIDAGGSLTLKKNAVYIFLSDGSKNSVSIYNNGTLQYEGTDNELTFETGIVIIPDNTMGSSVQYPPSYYSLAIKTTSIGLLGAEIPSVNSAKFSVLKEVMEADGLIAKENSGSSTTSVWEIAL